MSSQQRNIVILGASVSGLQVAHYFLQHTLPALKKKGTGVNYHVYLINPSSDYYFRVASPRTSASDDLLPAHKIILDLVKPFEKYSKSDFTFIQGSATGLDTSLRTVKYSRSKYLEEETLEYHALVVTTGSKTHASVYSMHTDTPSLLNDLKSMNNQVKTAKDIVLSGGGSTSIEAAGELGELLNGSPGWFSTPTRKVNIRLLTSSDRLLPTIRSDIGKIAEQKLKALGVEVVYKTAVTSAEPSKDGRTQITLSNGQKQEVDLYIPAHGVTPNSSWLPKSLLDDRGYLKTNSQTTRVDAAGPRVYSIGDIASFSRNNILDIQEALPVLMINFTRDLLSYDPASPNQKPKGSDRVFKPIEKDTTIIPIGSGGGVGAVFGWKLPSWAVWLIKSRDFMVGMSAAPLVSGDRVKKEFKWLPVEVV
ncbi:FAD/NAD(P)-binding domain-containing protein [Aaosphaeria arxii CBS 175.79]|uniref:FAD/NAD(P)-binding domain-containing protein n=1 Tax=Aaosphaeria arxii CBS 175.79 TaxID=1450172 RepID=A0A6A5XRD9_9PLEO|nr:FAD/NAD(P)-binding domain-containing protein [Aaosphaeria arxii CBS 175.79]KAF2015503.1 FAD/NAD(P)-binding domain-containing protein [Aaosphaeria arxii CBS 175.79]